MPESFLSLDPYVIVILISNASLIYIPVTKSWLILGLWMEEQPSAMEGICEYIE
jgi:hypothetical protein